METFLIKTKQEGCNCSSSTKNAKNGREREDRSSTQNGTERDGSERERNDKKEERERNDLAEGPRSRMGWNDFKKVWPSEDYCIQGKLEIGKNITKFLIIHSYFSFYLKVIFQLVLNCIEKMKR